MNRISTSYCLLQVYKAAPRRILNAPSHTASPHPCSGYLSTGPMSTYPLYPGPWLSINNGFWSELSGKKKKGKGRKEVKEKTTHFWQIILLLNQSELLFILCK